MTKRIYSKSIASTLSAFLLSLLVRDRLTSASGRVPIDSRAARGSPRLGLVPFKRLVVAPQNSFVSIRLADSNPIGSTNHSFHQPSLSCWLQTFSYT
jgi:hypothetical protein